MFRPPRTVSQLTRLNLYPALIKLYVHFTLIITDLQNLVNAQTGGIFAQSPKFQVVEGIKLASVVTSAVASSTQSIQGTSSSAAVAVATPVQNSLVGSGGLTNSASAAAADSSVLSSSISAASTISSASQLATGGVLASASGAVYAVSLLCANPNSEDLALFLALLLRSQAPRVLSVLRLPEQLQSSRLVESILLSVLYHLD